MQVLSVASVAPDSYRTQGLETRNLHPEATSAGPVCPTVREASDWDHTKLRQSSPGIPEVKEEKAAKNCQISEDTPVLQEKSTDVKKED